MRKAIIIGIALCLTGLVQAQEQRQPREAWNEVFTNRQGREFPHNKFLAETIRGRKPGRALDIGMGGAECPLPCNPGVGGHGLRYL